MHSLKQSDILMSLVNLFRQAKRAASREEGQGAAQGLGGMALCKSSLSHHTSEHVPFCGNSFGCLLQGGRSDLPMMEDGTLQSFLRNRRENGFHLCTIYCADSALEKIEGGEMHGLERGHGRKQP